MNKFISSKIWQFITVNKTYESSSTIISCGSTQTVSLSLRRAALSIQNPISINIQHQQTNKYLFKLTSRETPC